MDGRKAPRRRARSRLGLAGIVLALVATLLAVQPSPTIAHARVSDLPTVGDDIKPTVDVCERGRTASVTPTTAADCVAWRADGPVNVVIVYSAGRNPFTELLGQARPRWSPARGGWLVARGRLDETDSGCGVTVAQSGEQAELRLDAVTRRHAKLVHVSCPRDGWTAVFTNAHTDVYGHGRCRGDHMSDVDKARDALVQSLTSLPGATVAWHADHPRTQRYAGGCTTPITSDGRVAYVTLGS